MKKALKVRITARLIQLERLFLLLRQNWWGIFIVFIFLPTLVSADTAIIRPNADFSIVWTPTPAGTHFTAIDDAVTQPTAGDTADFIRSTNGGQTDEFELQTVTAASTTQVVIWAYAKTDTNDQLGINIIIDGVAQTQQNKALGTAFGWVSSTFSGLSLTQAQLDGLRIRLLETKIAAQDAVDVAAMYAEITFILAPDATSFTNNTEGGLTDGGRISQNITISGTNFGADPGAGNRSTAANNIKIGAFQIPDADVTAWSSTSITFIVSTSTNVLGGTGALTVTANNFSDGTALTFFVYPDITSLTTPSVSNAARENESITLNGNKFDTATGTVTILGITSTVTSWSDTAVAVTVPTSTADDVNTGNIVLTRNADSKTDTFAGFRLLPKIQGLSPTAGPVGTTVTISGDHFCQTGACPTAGQRNTATSSVTFNGTAVPDADVTTWTATSVVAIVPTGATTGATIVKSNSFDSNGVTFSVVIPPNATSFTNNTDAGLTDGGRSSHQITVSGTDFGAGPCAASTTEIKIGTFETPCANVSSWTSTTLVFTVPTGANLPVGGSGSNGLIVRRDDADDSSALTFFVYPRIATSTPASGRQGDTITVNGDAFGSTQGTSTVTINGATGTITSFAASGTSINVTIEGGTITGNIVFTRGADGKTSNNHAFTILPRVTAPTPTSSAASSAITISGDHFGTVTSTVTINGASAAISSWADTAIGVTVPSAATATGTIMITRSDSQTSNAFSFTVRPTISSLSSATGRVGDAITITGDHFGNDPGAGNRSTAVNNVSVNGAQVTDANVTAWSSSSITVVIPLAGAISGNVAVTANSAVSNASAFTILPKITAPTPTTGRTGDAITVSGDHFGAATSTVNINGATATISSWGDTTIGATVPTGGAATGTIVVTRFDSQASNAFSFTILPKIASLSPASGTAGDIITISGDRFGTDPGAANRSTAADNVKFNTVQVTNADVTAWSDASITAKVPIGATNGLVIIRRNNNDSNGVSFTVNTADATSFTNNTLALGDGGRVGDSITISGSNFGSGPCDGMNYAVKISATSTSCGAITSWTSSSISWTIPTSTAVYGGTSTNGLVVRAGGLDDATPLNFFIYPKIDSINVPAGFASDTAREFQSGDSDGVITLSGTRFGTGGAVTVLGQTATATSYADTSVTIQIPPAISDDLNTGNILLTRNNPADSKTATSTNFRILPRIAGLSPANGDIGVTVTITGDHFCQTGACPTAGQRNTATSSVTFNGTAVPDANVTTWNATSVIAKVPTGATTGSVIVKSNNFTSNGKTFSVGPPIPDAVSFTNNTEGGLTDGGRPGQSITVTGTDFGTACAVSSTEVKIGTFETACSFITSWASTSITFTLPTSTNTYGGTSTNGLIVRSGDQDDLTPLQFFVYPDVTGIITPSVSNAAREGETITLSGFRFGNDGAVTVLGTTASVVWGDTSVSVTIPGVIDDNTYTGAVVITRNAPAGGKSDTATSSFRILPRLTSLNPTSGAIGASVTISGDHFCQTGTCPTTGQRNTATSSVTFNGTAVPDADVTTWNATNIVAKVPTSATTGQIIVKSNNFSSNGLTFTVGTAAPVQAVTISVGTGLLTQQQIDALLVQKAPPPVKIKEIQRQINIIGFQIGKIEKEITALIAARTPKLSAPRLGPDQIALPPKIIPSAPRPIPPLPLPAPPAIAQKPTGTRIVIETPALKKPLIQVEPLTPPVKIVAVPAPVQPSRLMRLVKTAGENFIRIIAAAIDQIRKAGDSTMLVLNNLFEGIQNVFIRVPVLVREIIPRQVAPVPAPREIVKETEPVLPENIILRSGDLVLASKKDEPIQTVVGYQFKAEIKPVKPAKQITDTFKFADLDGDGVWTAEVKMPSFTGQFALAAKIDYEDGSSKQIQSPVLIDPEGYIFEQHPRGELRIADAKIALWQYESGQWILWRADRYGQKNPQITDKTGAYSFLAPAGRYYLEVAAKDYRPYRSEEFQLDTSSPVNKVIELKFIEK